ncbi:TP53 regulating kinase [Angomonas deanei]|nr:TP53 regulating kinase [Angomonas deanei]|eukprot:EPY43451.1 TP53 regulating kinase [Angomonas deanei]
MPAICKERFPKAYRSPLLDQRLREQRTTREARNLVKCREKFFLRTPTVLAVDKKKCAIWMEYIEGGKTIKECLDEEEEKIANTGKITLQTVKLLLSMGFVIGRLHSAGVVHGDLTTSNFMYCEEDDTFFQNNSTPSETIPLEIPQEVLAQISDNTENHSSIRVSPASIVILDFGLVPEKNNEEERAVDLYVLERALLSTHPFLEHTSTLLLLAGYQAGAVHSVAATANNHNREKERRQKWKATLTRLEAVRARGRKRSMVG